MFQRSYWHGSSLIYSLYQAIVTLVAFVVISDQHYGYLPMTNNNKSVNNKETDDNFNNKVYVVN